MSIHASFGSFLRGLQRTVRLLLGDLAQLLVEATFVVVRL
jgi:hypothetical protein